MRVVEDFKEYQILDMADGQKLEKWQNILLIRPDPQIIWPTPMFQEQWDKADAIYRRSSSGGGNWEIKKDIPTPFYVHYRDLTFCLKLMGFKHTGLFPEQATNWNLIRDVITKEKRPIKVLNLFAYTGAASVASLASGASVVHVDSSRGMVDWAKENVKVNHLEEKPIRFIVDDCLKFVEREIRRGNKYDAIVMDPPSYGRGPNGEVWKLENNLEYLVKKCSELLSDEPLFFLINAYTTGISSTVLYNILKLTVGAKYSGKIDNGEVGLQVRKNGLVLPCGIYGRWQS